MNHKTAVSCWMIVCCGLLSSCGGPKLDKSIELRAQAQKAITSGDTTKAIRVLTESLEHTPDAGAFLERARVYVDLANDDMARDDCEKALELDPNNQDVKWLLDQLAKPKEKRFQGAGAQPPSHGK
ncbi:MAG: hypothetical protein AAF497_12595 [Planctomycetota bacterium]